MANLKRRSGFTLLESALSLIILFCLAVLLQLLVQTSHHYQIEDLTPTSDWFLFVEELESNRHSFAITKVQPQSLGLIDVANGDEYDLISGKTLYLRGKRGGYLPILLNYQPHSVVFKRIDFRRVAIKAKTKDGSEHYAIAIFKDPGECDANQHDSPDNYKRSNSNQLSQSTKTTQRQSTYKRAVFSSGNV